MKQRRNEARLEKACQNYIRKCQTWHDKTRPDKIRPDQTWLELDRPDQTRPDQTRPGQIKMRFFGKNLNPKADFLFLWQNLKKDYESNESVRDENSVD